MGLQRIRFSASIEAIRGNEGIKTVYLGISTTAVLRQVIRSAGAVRPTSLRVGQLGNQRPGVD